MLSRGLRERQYWAEKGFESGKDASVASDMTVVRIPSPCIAPLTDDICQNLGQIYSVQRTCSSVHDCL